MSKVEKTIEGLEWDKRLKEVMSDEQPDRRKTYHKTNVVIAFLIGLLFGIIISGTLISNLTALL